MLTKFNPIILLFALLSAFLLTSRNFLSNNNIDTDLLIISNIILFGISYFTLMLQKKSMTHQNPNVFFRMVMGSMLTKMIVCVIAVIVYANYVGNNLNKGGIFISLFMYLVYLFTEVAYILKLNKKSNG